MARIDVLIGSTQPLYREVLASTLEAMRPDLAVRAVSEDELERHVLDLAPLLVICSEVSPTIADHAPAWIVLFPEERDEALVSVSGARRTIANATVAQLLRVVDEVRPRQVSS